MCEVGASRPRRGFQDNLGTHGAPQVSGSGACPDAQPQGSPATVVLERARPKSKVASVAAEKAPTSLDLLLRADHRN